MLWKEQINLVCNKVSKANYIINRTKKLMRIKDSLSIYNTLVNSYLNYGLMTWGGMIKVYPSFLRDLLHYQQNVYEKLVMLGIMRILLLSALNLKLLS